MTTVGVLGGTGPAGRGVAVRLASGDYDVVIGSREESRAIEVASALVPRGAGVVRGATNDVAADCKIVIVATPWDSAVATVAALKERLAGKIVISMVNALCERGSRAGAALPSAGIDGGAAGVRGARARIVGAFHHLPASTMEDLDSDLDADVIIFSDSAAARDEVAVMVDAMPGLHAVIAGSMSLAGTVEAFTAVCARSTCATRLTVT